MLSLEWLLSLFAFVLPAYVANAVPVLFRGKTPIDLGATLPDKKRLLGQGKTVKGFVAGVFFGTLFGIILWANLNIYSLGFQEKAIAAFLLSLGTMSGDALGSFIKRRMGFKQGQALAIFDQLFFLIVALAFAFAFKPQIAGQIGLMGTLILLFATYVLHAAANKLAHFLKLKKVPW